MKRLLFIFLTGCAAKAGIPASAPAVVVGRASPSVPIPKSPRITCAQLLEVVAEAPLGPQPDGRGEAELVSALGACESVLVAHLSPGDKDELNQGRAILILSFTGISNEELWSYAGLLHRFALATEMRRILHFGPVLARLFSLRAIEGTCTLGSREQALYLSLTPKAFGGDTARGDGYFAGSQCKNDQRLAGEIDRLR